MLRQSNSEFDGSELEVEGQDHFHLSIDQVLARLDDVEPGVNPDDLRCTPKCKGSPESPGDAHGSVVVEDLQVDSITGEAQDHENPSFELEASMLSEDGPKDVRLAEGEWRLGGLEDIRDINLKGCEAFLI